MTTTTRTSSCPVPTADEIGFPALHRPAFAVLTGGDPRAAADAVSQVVRMVAPDAVTVAPVGPGFVTLDGIAAVRAALLPVVRREAPELLGTPWLASGLPTAGRRAKRVGMSYLAESVTFAVTRRISRESHQAALIIDGIAGTLLRVRRTCPTFAAGMTLVIPALHAWDRPSLRCLYRMVLLAEPDDRLSVVALASSTMDQYGAGENDVRVHIGPARERFFQRLAGTGVVRIMPLPAGPPTADPDAAHPVGASGADTSAEPGDNVPDAYPDLLLALGDALVFQNYERVYHLARYALERAADAEQEAQARRLVAIAQAQLDDFDAAAEGLARAAELTADPAFGAHLHYLRGLIATKRHYDLDAADRHYARGLSVLGEPEPDEDVQRRVERAWLFNGRALVLTLRAKAVGDAEARERLMRDAFDLELRAFRLVRGVPGAAPAYLRHNLMANLTFLLEISRRFDEAVSFWTRAFEAYLASDSREFRVAFDARLGLLLFKAGRRDEGVALLEKARTVAHELGDRFGEEELCLKLGYAYGAIGDPERAYHAYRDGLGIAHGLREADICLDALAGMLWSLAEAGAVDSFDALTATVLAVLPGTALAERLRALPAPGSQPREPVRELTDAGLKRPMPSPKQRAYIPSVDLEGTPTHDLNRYLVWGGGALPRRAREGEHGA
jgi:tetratricopeptide (TPR) repeat protein